MGGGGAAQDDLLRVRVGDVWMVELAGQDAAGDYLVE